MKKYIFILTIFLATPLYKFAHAQTTSRALMVADYLYNHYAFNEAIEHYEKAAPEITEPVALAKLGDCYRLTKNPEKAAEWYEQASKMEGCPDYVKLHYAQTLMTLGRYKEAIPLLEEYKKDFPDDRRIANMITSCEKEGKVGNPFPEGVIHFQKFNTDGLEFGPSIRTGQLVFTTDTVLDGTKDKKDKWMGTSFYQMYKVDCEKDGTCDHELKKISNKVNTKYHDGPSAFTSDGRKMFFTRTNHNTQFLSNGPVSDHNDVVHLQIMIAEDFDAEKGDYKKIKKFNYNSHLYSVAHPTVIGDGSIMIFASDMPGGYGGTDLYFTAVDFRGRWSKPMNLGKAINTEGDEMFPFIAGDSVLYFTSNGHVGMGGLDIYKSRWKKSEMTFTDPINMGIPINSTYDDMSYVIKDNQNAYFSSNRPAAKKGDNIYSFHRMMTTLTITAIDDVTGLPIASVVVDLKSADQQQLLTGDPRGTVSSRLMPNSLYSADLKKVGYEPAFVKNISTQDLTEHTHIERVVRMKPNFKIMYHVVVLDERTKKPIEDPTLVFTENQGIKSDTLKLKTGETFNTPLETEKTYHVYAFKNNYYSNERFISTKNIKTGIGTTHIYDTVYMQKLVVGGIYKIDNIYYDYDKATIRESAKPALDKLLEILQEYPEMKIQINSHTDCRGNDAYNLRLSNSRAGSVVYYLIEKGVSLDRLKYKGYGETAPVYKRDCEKCTEVEHQENRRTEFQITSLSVYNEM